jgi:hypothetical protein
MGLSQSIINAARIGSTVQSVEQNIDYYLRAFNQEAVEKAGKHSVPAPSMSRNEFVNMLHDGILPLDAALRSSRADYVILLLQCGADITKVKDGLTRILEMRFDYSYLATINFLESLDQEFLAGANRLWLTRESYEGFKAQQMKTYASLHAKREKGTLIPVPDSVLEEYANACVRSLESGKAATRFVRPVIDIHSSAQKESWYEAQRRENIIAQRAIINEQRAQRGVRFKFTDGAALHTLHERYESGSTAKMLMVEGDDEPCTASAAAKSELFEQEGIPAAVFKKEYPKVVREQSAYHTDFSQQRGSLIIEINALVMQLALRQYTVESHSDKLKEALRQAIMQSNEAVIIMLLKQGLDPDAEYHGAHFVNLAIANGISGAVICLMLPLCKKTIHSDDGSTPLHLAVMFNRSELVGPLVRFDPDMLSAKDRGGDDRECETPVMMAARLKTFAVSYAILQHDPEGYEKGMLKELSLESSQYAQGFVCAHLMRLVEKNNSAGFFGFLYRYQEHLEVSAGRKHYLDIRGKKERAQYRLGQHVYMDEATCTRKLEEITGQARQLIADLFSYSHGVVKHMLECKRFNFINDLSQSFLGGGMKLEQYLDYYGRDEHRDVDIEKFLFTFKCNQLREIDSQAYVAWLERFCDREDTQVLFIAEVRAHRALIELQYKYESGLIAEDFKPYQKISIKIAALQSAQQPVPKKLQEECDMEEKWYLASVELSGNAHRILDSFDTAMGKLSSATEHADHAGVFGVSASAAMGSGISPGGPKKKFGSKVLSVLANRLNLFASCHSGRANYSGQLTPHTSSSQLLPKCEY